MTVRSESSNEKKSPQPKCPPAGGSGRRATNSAAPVRSETSALPSAPANGNAIQTDSSRLSAEAAAEEQPEAVDELLSGMAQWAGSAEETAANPEAGASGAAEAGTGQRLELVEGQLLSQGRQSEPGQVTQLQEMLNARGAQLELDGLFGPRTAEAVREFQRQNNLTVDGIVGPQTMGALNGGGVAPANGGPSQPAPGDLQQPANPEQGPAPGDLNSSGVPDPNNPEAANADGPKPPTPGNSSAGRLEGLPDRAPDAMGGRAFMESISHLPPGAERDRAVLNEFLSGNIPESSRTLREVVVQRDGREIRMQAMSDYLAIGSDQDNVRVPMTPAVAQAIADRTGTSLPTDRMVDDIHAQAQQLYMPALSNNREGIGTYLHHDGLIDEQLGGQTAGGLVSGHKKDLVIPHRDGRVAIYGGRWQSGGRIQNYSNVHHDGYEDYSHGARLVSQQVTIDGRTMRLEEALADPSLRGLFTSQSGSFSY